MNSSQGSIIGGSAFLRPDGYVRIGIKGDEPRDGEIQLKARTLSLSMAPGEANQAQVEVFVAECDVVAKPELTTVIGGVEYLLVPAGQGQQPEEFMEVFFSAYDGDGNFWRIRKWLEVTTMEKEGFEHRELSDWRFETREGKQVSRLSPGLFAVHTTLDGKPLTVSVRSDDLHAYQ